MMVDRGGGGDYKGVCVWGGGGGVYIVKGGAGTK